MNERQLEGILQRLSDGRLEQSALPELELELLSNKNSLCRYMEVMEFETLLQLEAERAHPTTFSVIPVCEVMRRQRRRSIRMATLAAAAILLLTLVVMRLFFVKDEVSIATYDVSSGTILKVDRPTGHEGDEDEVEIGTRLRLEQGVVKLKLVSGVKAVILAPADLTIHGENELYLRQGSASFQVPEDAVGFTVTTTDLKVVDLGTEFGVISRPDDHDEVHVTKGSVRATALRVRKETAVITAGHARRIDPIGRLKGLIVNPDAFLYSLPEELPHIHWSFDDSEQVAAVTGTHPEVKSMDSAVVTGTGSTIRQTEGVRGDAITMDGSKQAIVTDWKGFNADRPRSMCCWVKIPKGSGISENPVMGWGDPYISSAKWKVSVGGEKGSRSVILRASFSGHRVNGTTDLADGKWHHIAVTTVKNSDKGTGSNVNLYVDGELESTDIVTENDLKNARKIDTRTSTKDARNLSIGVSLVRPPLRLGGILQR